MAGTRAYLPDFAFANPLYAGATVTVYTVDPKLLTATTTLATCYADLTSQSLLANPQTLDGEGKWQQPVYVGVPVIMHIGGAQAEDHSTGITGTTGTFRGDWAPNTLYFGGDVVRDGAAGTNTSNVYYCAAGHTSSVFVTDLAAGDWLLYISATAISAGAVASAVAAALAAVTAAGYFSITGLPTTKPGTAGIAWNNGGVFCIS